MVGMDNLAVWNVRGLNSPSKQREVLAYTIRNKIGLVGFVETKLKPNSFARFYSNTFQGWCIVSNITLCKGGRIMVCWLHSHFQVEVKRTTPQCIHLGVINLAH